MSTDKEHSIESILHRTTGPSVDEADMVRQLVPVINDYINNDFEKLVQLLYRIDVDEQKVKQTLQQNSEADAGLIIARLVVERHLQKFEARKRFSGNRPPLSEEDSW